MSYFGRCPANEQKHTLDNQCSFDGEFHGIIFNSCAKHDDCDELIELDYGSRELMQFTGLYDINGKEIYEGDIGRRHMNYIFEGKPVYHYDDWIVEFHSGSFLTVKIGERPNQYSQRFNEIEIIGNIHENKQ